MAPKLTRTLATFFGIGYLPAAPGSFASIAAVLIFLATGAGASPVIQILLISWSAVIGFVVAGPAEKLLGATDPKPVVIDEVCGMFVALFLLPINLYSVLIAFLLFRAFDIFMPFPIRRIEKLPGSAGIMLDDIAAGIYANLATRLVLSVIASP